MSIEIGGLVLYDIEEVAAKLGVGHRYVRKLLKDRELVGRRLAKKWYISEEALAEYFYRHDEPSTRSAAVSLHDRKERITDIEQVDGILPNQEEGRDGS